MLFNVGIFEVSELVLACPLFPAHKFLTTTVSAVDMIFCGRSVKLPIFRDPWPEATFSLWVGEPDRYIGRFPATPPATGSLLGDGVRGELDLSSCPCCGNTGPNGELARVADAIKAFRSDNELRRFFLADLAVLSFSSGGGEAPMVLNLEDCV